MTTEEVIARCAAKDSRYAALSGKPAAARPVKADCPHRGDKLPAYGTCAEGCGTGVRVPLFACAVHGTCSTALRTTEGHRCCKRCPDNPTAAPPAVIRPALTAALSTPHPYPADRFAGRGIVTAAGGRTYLACAYVMVRLLRQTGCTLPVEVWHLGPDEVDDAATALFDGLNVAFVDARARGFKLGGWELKAFAVANSPFRHVLFLDADNLPARDPSFLFDSPEYAAAGALAWPDYPPEGWKITAEGFRAAGLPVPAKVHPRAKNPSGYVAWETGQLVIDKARHWHALAVWQAMGDDREFWYGGVVRNDGSANLVYGDKDTAFLAWQTTKTDAFVAPPAGWVGDTRGGCFVQGWTDDSPLFYHRVQPPTKFDQHAAGPEGIPHWADCLRYLAEFRSSWHPPGAGRWVLFDGSEDGVPLTLHADGTSDRGKWNVSGGVLSVAGRRLGRDDHGNWCNHGTGTFLMPAPEEGIAYHPHRPDLSTYNSTVRLNEYRLPDRFPPGSVAVDVGAHCGFFTRAVLDRGISFVVAVEPVPDNLRLLWQNTAGLPVLVYPVAAWSSHGTVRLNTCPGAEASTGWSAVSPPEGGISVPSLPLNEILAATRERGPIAVLKLDCEGAEFECLRDADLSGIGYVCGEYHLARSERSPEELSAILERAGFQCSLVPNAEGIGWFFACPT